MTRILLGLLGVLLALAPANTIKAAESFSLVTIGHGYWAAPLYVAQQAELFEKHGLAPVVSNVKGGSLALQALLSKNADVALVSYEHIVKAASKGQRVVAISRLVNRNIVNIVGSKDLVSAAGDKSVAERIQALEGKRVGVSSAGASSDKMLTVLGNRYGLDITTVQKVFLGGSPGAYVAAIQNDAVDAAFVVEPAGSMVERAGIGSTYVDIMGGEVPEYSDLIFMVVATHPDFIEEKPDLLRKVALVFEEALSILKQDSEQSKQLLAQEYPDMDPTLNAEVYDTMAPVWTPTGRMSAAAGESVIDYLLLEDPSVESVDVTSTFNNGFVAE